MEEKNDLDRVDEVMLPGFRFHPTDEELVGFYLKRKVQQQPLPVELIKQVDIYKYDPWDLPKLATTGEKEWYFYCPRDRKYRNSARPNRVTGAGFWKATGTDRPIYSSDGTKCIGLKKSLVFYRGRAAKGFKTDWMMHEFRLPSSSSLMPNSSPPKKPLDKSFPAHDSWAICRIFKKTNSMAQRALSHSWVPSMPEISASEIFSHGVQCSEFSPENISCTTEIASALQFCSNNSTDLQQQQQQTCTTNFSAQNLSPYTKPTLFPFSNGEIPSGFMFSPLEVSGATKSSVDGGSMILSPAMISSVSANNNASESVVEFDGSNSHFSDFSMNLPHDVQGNMDKSLGSSQANNNNQWGPIRSLEFPFNLPGNDQPWKPNLSWDSPPCPSDMSSSFSTNKCYN